MIKHHLYLALIVLLVHGSSSSFAEDRLKATSHAADGNTEDSNTKAPSSLIILFNEGSSKLQPIDRSTLDRASRAYNEGKPIVMIITGGADRTGSGIANLRLSQERANAVLHALIDRGIPADRFQVLAKGETELPVPTRPGVPDRENRRVVISWH